MVDKNRKEVEIEEKDGKNEKRSDAFFKAATPFLAMLLVAVCALVSLLSYEPYEYTSVTSIYASTDYDTVTSSETTTGSTELEEVEDAAAYADGTYYGSGTGYRGTITVKVVISGGVITSITVIDYSDDDTYFSKAKTLISSIISGQTTNVDTVSGATYSSVGIINAVRDALSQAAVTETDDSDELTVSTAERIVVTGESGAFPYPDGTYYGTGEGYGGDIVVAVTISDYTITSITIVSAEDETEEYFSLAAVLADEVVTAQSTDLDVVSGATYSSNGILEAIENALEAAAAAAEDESDSDSDIGEDTDVDTDGDIDANTEDDTDDSISYYTNGDYSITVITYDVSEDEDDRNFDDYEITFTITIYDDQITNITYDSDQIDSGNITYVKKAVYGTSSKTGMLEKISALIGECLTEDSVDELDAVSTATCSSTAVKDAVKQVLSEALISSDSGSDDVDSDSDSDEKDADSSSNSASEDYTVTDEDLLISSGTEDDLDTDFGEESDSTEGDGDEDDSSGESSS